MGRVPAPRLRLRGGPRPGLRPAARDGPAGPGRPVVPVARRCRLVSREVRRQGPARVGPPRDPPDVGLVQCGPGAARRVRQGGRRTGPAGSGGRPGTAGRATPLPLQRGRVRRPRLALRGVAAKGARLPVPARQAQGRARRVPAGRPHRQAAARPPRRPPRRRQHGLGRRAGAGGHRPAPSGRHPFVRAAGRQRRPRRPRPAGPGVVGRDRGGRGPDRPRLAAAVHRPSRLHGRERADLQVRRPGRRLRPLPGGAGRRPHAAGRLPGRRVVAAVGRAPDAAPGAGAADAGGALRRRLLRAAPAPG